MKYKGAILGLGNIAQRSHIPTYLKLSTEVEIIAGADKAAENRAAFGRVFPKARVYQDAKELLIREELDFVDICTPPYSHAQLIVEASRRGYHILCEKPLCTSAEEAERISQVVRGAETVFLPCHQYRYSPQWLSLSRLVASGAIGVPAIWQVKVERTQANPGNPHWEPRWRTDSTLSGGGIVLDHGIHQFYLGRLLLGKPRWLEAKLSCLRYLADGIEDTAQVTIQHAQGLFRLDMTWAARVRRTEQVLQGSTGEITLTETELQLRDLQGRQLMLIPWGEGLSKDSAHTGWYEKLLRRFLDCLKTGKSDPEALDEAIYTMRCAHLAYESARGGQAVPYELP